MSCRRTSSWASSPATGRSRSSSSRISKGWHSGSRSKSPADGAPRHDPLFRVGARVPRSRLTILSASVFLGLASAVPGPSLAGTPPPAPPAEARPAAAPEATPAPAPEATPPPTPEATPAPAPAPGQESALQVAAPGAPATGGKGVIGSIVVDGNVRVSDVAFYNSLKLKKGDPYDEVAIREEFRRVWDLNLFDDMTVEARQRTPGVYDLIFHVRDRPLISNVAFVGMKAVTETNIQERLNQAKVEVRRGQPVDFSVLRRAEAAIEQLLAEKGYLQSHVRAKLLQINPGQREVTFYIHEGGKTKIKKIDFIGNTVFPSRTLRKMLKLTKQAFWLTSWASSKSLYHPAKFDQDSENMRAARGEAGDRGGGGERGGRGGGLGAGDASQAAVRRRGGPNPAGLPGGDGAGRPQGGAPPGAQGEEGARQGRAQGEEGSGDVSEEMGLPHRPDRGGAAVPPGRALGRRKHRLQRRRDPGAHAPPERIRLQRLGPEGGNQADRGRLRGARLLLRLPRSADRQAREGGRPEARDHGRQEVLRRSDRVHGQHHDARQGPAPGDAPGRAGPVQRAPPAARDPQDRPARILPGRRRPGGEAGGGHREGGHRGPGNRVEPQRDPGGWRRVGARGGVLPGVLLEAQLPRQGGDPLDLHPDRRPHESLLDQLHRALVPRQALDPRLLALQEADRLHQLPPDRQRRELGAGAYPGQLQPLRRDLRLRA